MSKLDTILTAPDGTDLIAPDRLRELVEADRDGRGTWREIRNAYGELEGWIHEDCGRSAKEASEYCPKCGKHMTPAEAEAALKGGAK